MRKLVVAALAALLIAGGIGVWLWTRETREAPVVAGPADIARFERLAVKSCRCERTGRSEDECWADYRRATSDVLEESWATACAPVSTSADCFKTASGQECIVVGWGIKGVCTQEEARAVEHAWSSAYDGVDRDDEQALMSANDRANEAMADVIARIRNGERVSVPPAQEGCA